MDAPVFSSRKKVTNKSRSTDCQSSGYADTGTGATAAKVLPHWLCIPVTQWIAVPVHLVKTLGRALLRLGALPSRDRRIALYLES